MNDRAELDGLFKAYGIGHVDSRVLADAMIQIGFRKPRTITTAEELDALQYGAAVVHDEGWGETIAQRHTEDMRWYVTGCLEYIRPEALLPATIIHEPRFF
jgi:hypothetical protein